MHYQNHEHAIKMCTHTVPLIHIFIVLIASRLYLKHFWISPEYKRRYEVGDFHVKDLCLVYFVIHNNYRFCTFCT